MLFITLLLPFYKKPIESVPILESIHNISLHQNKAKEKLTPQECTKVVKMLKASYSNLFKERSTDDIPRVKVFYTIKIQKKNDEIETFYVYKKGNHIFVEHPYEGIYHASDKLFDFVSEILKNNKKSFDQNDVTFKRV